MAADWGTFINNVSGKLTSQSIRSYEEMADFLRKEYISATVGKAASPYGETHVKGNDNIMFEGFKKGFKILYEGGDLSFEDKKTSPEYVDLDVQPPTVDISGAADQVDIDFRTWTEENASTIPDFTYSQFFSQYPNFPRNRKQTVIEIARKILHQFDGTSSYLQWMYSLRTGAYSDWGNLVMNQVVKLIEGETNRPLKEGDIVRGYAKFAATTAIYFIKTNFNGGINPSVYRTDYPTNLGTVYGYESKTLQDSFELIKGDVNIDNQQEFSDTKMNMLSGEGGQSKGDLLEGKIVSLSSSKIKISYFSKQYNRTLIREIIPETVNRKLDIKEVAANLPSVSLSNKLLQEQHYMNPNKIPDYLTANFIRNFTYSKKYDGGYLRQFLKRWLSESNLDDVLKEFDDSYTYVNDLTGILNNGILKNSFYRDNSRLFENSNYTGGTIFNTFDNDIASIRQTRDRNKSADYAAEEERYRNLKIRWINEIAEAARKNEDPDKPEDGYFVMAKAVLDYWKSCNVQPLSKEPGAPPALFSPPQGGIYIPVYYGSQTMLGSNIKRAFNTGKRFREQYEKQIASKMVASALAYSFSIHLLELKFIYRGGIPGPNGPIPMIGFIPLVY